MPIFNPRPVRVDLSTRRRVLVAGDLHGCHDILQSHLERLGFDGSQDTLVLLGDLADRGPQSPECVRLLEQPGILCIAGNHEQLLLDSFGDPDDSRAAINFMRNGGAWFARLASQEQAHVAALLAALPLSIEAVTPAGHRVGFLHGGLPHNDWGMLDPASFAATPDEIADLVWDRDVIADALRFLRLGGDPCDFPKVRNIDHVFHGHSIVGRPVTLGNRSWIDTGAFQSGVLSVLDVDQWLARLAENVSA